MNVCDNFYEPLDRNRMSGGVGVGAEIPPPTRWFVLMPRVLSRVSFGIAGVLHAILKMVKRTGSLSDAPLSGGLFVIERSL